MFSELEIVASRPSELAAGGCLGGFGNVLNDSFCASSRVDSNRNTAGCLGDPSHCGWYVVPDQRYRPSVIHRASILPVHCCRSQYRVLHGDFRTVYRLLFESDSLGMDLFSSRDPGRSMAGGNRAACRWRIYSNFVGTAVQANSKTVISGRQLNRARSE